MTIRFPGGVKVEADLGTRTIATDQNPTSGGDGSAPEPYDLFLASIGTCSGFYAVRFCQQRQLDTDGMEIVQRWERGDGGRLERVRLELRLPESFPDKYREAIVRAIGQCPVKRALESPPEVITTVV